MSVDSFEDVIFRFAVSRKAKVGEVIARVCLKDFRQAFGGGWNELDHPVLIQKIPVCG